MADTTFTGLTTIADPLADGDVFAVADISAAASRGVTFATLRDSINAQPNALLVTAESDLSDYLAGSEYQLPAATLIEPRGIITLTAGRYLTLPQSSGLLGRTTVFDGFQGSYAGALLQTSGVGTETTRIQGCRLDNTSSDPAAYALDYNCANGTLAFLDSRAVCPTTGAASTQVKAGNNVGIEGSTMEGSTGLEFSGTIVSIGFNSCLATGNSATGFGVNFAATASVTVLSIDQVATVTGAVGAIGWNVDGAATISDTNTDRMLHFGAGTANSGFDQSTWNVVGSNFLPDSSTGGSCYLSTPVTVSIGVAGTYYGISDGVTSAWTLDTDAERFSLSDALTGELTYNGPDTRNFLITGHVCGDIGSGAKQFEVDVFRNGVATGEAESVRDFSNRTGSMALGAHVHSLSNGDTIDIRIKNNDDTTNPTIQRASLAIIVAS
jgi:hypothetical protein